MQAHEFTEPKIGINVRSDGNIDYAELIISGKKKLESRTSDSLRPYVGKRVAIVRTGAGQAIAIGSVIIGEPIVVDEKKFRELEKFHLVPKNSKFDIIPNSEKFLYPMLNPIRFNKPKSVGKGIVSRKIYDESYPGTYEQEYGMFKSRGPERIIAMTYENKNYNLFVEYDTSIKGLYKDLVRYIKSKDVKSRIRNELEKASNAREVGNDSTADRHYRRYDKLVNLGLNKQELEELKCWPGYHRVKGTKAGAQGSCAKNTNVAEEEVTEKWSEKYKRSINCNNPKGFSQRAHCQGRKKHRK